MGSISFGSEVVAVISKMRIENWKKWTVEMRNGNDNKITIDNQ